MPTRKANLAKARELLHAAPDANADPHGADAPLGPVQPSFLCPQCGASMIIIDTFVRGQPIRAPPKQRGAA